MTLEEILRRHPDRLVRTHRSHLVNPSAVREMEVRPRGGLVLKLKSGSEVPVSCRYADNVMARLAIVPEAAFSSQPPSGR
jgi:two-component system, LytTR family, response regulator